MHVEDREEDPDAQGPGAARQLDLADRDDAPVRRFGRADFLMRVEKPSDLGDWSYEVWDTKLARHAKASAVLQLCFYSDLLAGLQGVPAEHMALALGGNVRKGEHGTTVVYADRFVPDDEKKRALKTGEEAAAIPFLKRFTVFNTVQCDNLPEDVSIVAVCPDQIAVLVAAFGVAGVRFRG